jgi:hypothetical protein
MDSKMIMSERNRAYYAWAVISIASLGCLLHFALSLIQVARSPSPTGKGELLQCLPNFFAVTFVVFVVIVVPPFLLSRSDYHH